MQFNIGQNIKVFYYPNIHQWTALVKSDGHWKPFDTKSWNELMEFVAQQ